MRMWRKRFVAPAVLATCVASALLLASSPLSAASRVEVADGFVASIVDGTLYLEATPLRAEGLLAFARRLCGSEQAASKISAANQGAKKLSMGVRYKVPFEFLRPELQLQVVRALFGDDRPTSSGWEHVVLAPEASSVRPLDSIAFWFTGSHGNSAAVAEHNRIDGHPLSEGQKVVIPNHLLATHFRSLLPPPPPTDLAYDHDERGEFAVYRLKAGEALYSSVVVRFTGNVYADDVNALAKEVAQRSGIRDVTDIPVDFAVKIPLDLLLPEFLPEGHSRRMEYEQSLVASAQFGTRPRLSHLDGVTVILDAGHGGKDVGATMSGVWESLYVYDIMLRTKKLLEERTAASVLATTRDGDSFRIASRDVLPYSRGHSVLTTPNYRIEDSSVGAHLRWYLANSIFRQATSHGHDSGKVVFLSIHADSLHSSLRGAMAYIPGAEYRGGSYQKRGAVYASRLEVRERPQVSFARKDLIKSEGLSRELAQQLLGAFAHSGLAVHEFKPIREKIIRNRRSWVPAVLRYNQVPAEVLLEVCNLGNSEDRRLIQTREHRQRVAEAVFRGILSYYGDESVSAPTRVVAGP